MKRSTPNDRREHLRVDAALSEVQTVPLIPRVARELIGDFVRSLAERGLLHQLQAEELRRALGADDV